MSRAPTTLSDESLHLQSLYCSYVLRWFLPTHVWNVGQGCEPTLNSSDYQPLWDTGTPCPARPGSAISRHSQDAQKGCARHPRTGVLHRYIRSTAQVFKKTNRDDITGKGFRFHGGSWENFARKDLQIASWSSVTEFKFQCVAELDPSS